MIRTRWIATFGMAALVAAGCGKSAPYSPSEPSAFTMSSTTSASSPSKPGPACTVDVGTTQHRLPAFHELEGWLNSAITAAGSSLNCGEVRSLDAKAEELAKALDR